MAYYMPNNNYGEFLDKSYLQRLTVDLIKQIPLYLIWFKR